jgi:hypothetical protein
VYRETQNTRYRIRAAAVRYGCWLCFFAKPCYARRATSKIKPDQNPIGLIGDAQFLAKISVMLLGKQVADPKTLKFLLVPLGGCDAYICALERALSAACKSRASQRTV